MSFRKNHVFKKKKKKLNEHRNADFLIYLFLLNPMQI